MFVFLPNSVTVPNSLKVTKNNVSIRMLKISASNDVLSFKMRVIAA